MIEKDPTTFTALTYLWVFLLAISGGVVRFIRRLGRTDKKLTPFDIFVKFFGELTISAFAGIITFYLCEYWELDGLLTAVMVAVSGHLGGSAIDKIVRIWDAVTNKSV